MLKSIKIAIRSFLPVLGLSLLALSLMAMGQIKSNLTIPAKQAFELGGKSNKGYKVKAQNRGVQTIQIFTLTADEERAFQGEVKPGETKVFKIPAKTSTVLVNESVLPAKIFATITGDTDLGMSYFKVKEWESQE
ncbi:MAG: hypothetical protein AAF927_12775 [Bacteroidota bacterium]